LRNTDTEDKNYRGSGSRLYEGK